MNLTAITSAKITLAPALSSEGYVNNIKAAAKNCKAGATADQLFAEFEKVSAGKRYTRSTFDRKLAALLASPSGN